jgi:hypothetical protein
VGESRAQCEFALGPGFKKEESDGEQPDEPINSGVNQSLSTRHDWEDNDVFIYCRISIHRGAGGIMQHALSIRIGTVIQGGIMEDD